MSPALRQVLVLLTALAASPCSDSAGASGGKSSTGTTSGTVTTVAAGLTIGSASPWMTMVGILR